ncbi:uncharacterized protein LOC144219987 isoform X2 [Crocuta crocuta]
MGHLPKAGTREDSSPPHQPTGSLRARSNGSESDISHLSHFNPASARLLDKRILDPESMTDGDPEVIEGKRTTGRHGQGADVARRWCDTRTAGHHGTLKSSKKKLTQYNLFLMSRIVK